MRLAVRCAASRGAGQLADLSAVAVAAEAVAAVGIRSAGFPIAGAHGVARLFGDLRLAVAAIRLRAGTVVGSGAATELLAGGRDAFGRRRCRFIDALAAVDRTAAAVVDVAAFIGLADVLW